MKHACALLLTIALIMIACEREHLPYYHTADFTPWWPGEQPVDVDTLHTIANFSFIDQEGNRLTRDSLRGRVYVANFFFTACPSICPRMTDELQEVQRAFSDNKRVNIVSHSVMPWVDSVSRLREFAAIHHVHYPQWRLVTGRQRDIYELARQSYFAEEVAGFTRDSTDFVHTEHCLLVDGDGHLRGIYNGTLRLEIERLITDIRILLDE